MLGKLLPTAGLHVFALTIRSLGLPLPHKPPCQRPAPQGGSACPDHGSCPYHHPTCNSSGGSICSNRPHCNCISAQPGTPTPNKTSPPKFHTIESVSQPGYFVTQLVLDSRNVLNPFQLWYRDDSWSFLGNACVFINHGSKKALKSQLSSTSPSILYKATVGVYDPSVHDDSVIWSYNGNEKEPMIILHANKGVQLSHGWSSSGISDTVPVITSKLTPMHANTEYDPTPMYKIQCPWGNTTLTSKERLADFKPQHAITQTDEHNVVTVDPTNQLDGMIWYKVPAGGTTFGSSFIVINSSQRFHQERR